MCLTALVTSGGVVSLANAKTHALHSVHSTVVHKKGHAQHHKGRVAHTQLSALNGVTKGEKNHRLHGLASVYADSLVGRRTASGQHFSQEKMTAAHRYLPLGSRVLVTNLRNNRSVEVSINDRGPFHRGRVIDLSSSAASQLGIHRHGVTSVKLQVLPPQNHRDS